MARIKQILYLIGKTGYLVERSPRGTKIKRKSTLFIEEIIDRIAESCGIWKCSKWRIN
jgi:hypothetical protein